MNNTAAPTQPPPIKLPKKAEKMALRVCQIAEERNNNGRIMFELIFVNGRWLFSLINKEGVEDLGVD